MSINIPRPSLPQVSPTDSFLVPHTSQDQRRAEAQERERQWQYTLIDENKHGEAKGRWAHPPDDVGRLGRKHAGACKDTGSAAIPRPVVSTTAARQQQGPQLYVKRRTWSSGCWIWQGRALAHKSCLFRAAITLPNSDMDTYAGRQQGRSCPEGCP